MEHINIPYKQNISIQECVKRFIDGEIDIYTEYVAQSAVLMKEFHKEIQRQVKDRTKKYYYYLITFTLKPEIKEKDYDKIEKFILEQCARPALHIREAEYVKEYTKKKIPHWHIAVKSEKFISKNRFNYYCQKYGNIDISKSTNNSLTESLNYINKESQSIKLI